jgi:acyl carrier protein
VDGAALRSAASSGGLHPMFRGLVRQPPTRAVDAGAGGPALADRLAGLPPPEARQLLLDVVRGHVAGVLGHAGTGPVGTERGLLDMGIDSLTAVELRNRLNRDTGLRLPTTLAFDYPTPAAIAEYLRTEIASGEAAAPRGLVADFDRLEAALARVGVDAAGHARISTRLQDLLWRWTSGPGAAGDRIAEDAAADLATASDDELFQALDGELGATQVDGPGEPGLAQEG